MTLTFHSKKQKKVSVLGGGTVVQWLTLLPPCKKGPWFDPHAYVGSL